MLSNEMIKGHLDRGELEEIIIGLMPLAKKIGHRSPDEYSEALQCLVKKVLEELPGLAHGKYREYLAKSMKGVCYTWRSNLSVVPIPQKLYRFMKRNGREVNHEYLIDITELPDLITIEYHNDVFEYVEKGLRHKEIFRCKMIGLSDPEIAAELGVSQQYVSRLKIEMLEEIRVILKRIEVRI